MKKMKKNNHACLRLVVSDGAVLSTRYKSGRSRCRGMPETASMFNTRSAGTRPRSSQLDTVLCAPTSKSLASALCPPTALQASKSASVASLSSSLVMSAINAQTDNAVNAYSVNQRPENVRMGKKAELPASAFWKRLAECLPSDWAPVNTNSVATRLDMSQGSIHRWYIGPGLPELPTALYLAKEAGVCIDWLLNNVKPKYPISKDPILRELFEVCEELDEAARSRILHSARGEVALKQEANHEKIMRVGNSRGGTR